MSDRLAMPDGSTFEIVRVPADPERDPSEIVFTTVPGGPAPPPHVHPRQREVFTLESGDFELLVSGDWRTLSPGETLAVEPGQVHTFRNRGSEVARVRTVHEPALSFQSYIRDLHATLVEHDISKVTPAAAIRMSALFRRYSDTIQPGPLPLKVAMGVAGRLAPLLRLEPAGRRVR